MLTPSRMLCAALAAGCVSSAPGAEARTSRPTLAHHHPHPVIRPEEPNPRLMVRLGLDAGSARQGALWGVLLGVEGKRWGVSTRLTGLSLWPESGAGGRDLVQVAEGNVTFSPLAGERGRLRLEGGVTAVRAPGVTIVGPSVALSFERCLFGALDVEGRVRWVPLPLTQLDAQLDLAVHLGVLTLRAGWRGLFLDYGGHVARRESREAVGGPFVGLGFNF